MTLTHPLPLKKAFKKYKCMSFILKFYGILFYDISGMLHWIGILHIISPSLYK